MAIDNYMQMAINEARKGIMAGDGGPFGAVVVRDGVVIGRHGFLQVHECLPGVFQSHFGFLPRCDLPRLYQRAADLTRQKRVVSGPVLV